MIKKDKSKNFGGPLDITIKKLQLVFNRRFREAGMDITADQWRVMIILYQDGKDGLSQSDLCDGSSKGAPTVSRIIDLLCKKGYTRRSRFKEDRRKYKIHLTKKGEGIVEKGYPIVLDMRSKGWKKLSNADYDHLIRILKQLRDNFEDIL